MTTDPTLTDEELLGWEIAWRANAQPPPVMRLVAALRASRQAEERQSRLRSEDIAHLQAQLQASREEVERLRTELENANDRIYLEMNGS